MPYPSIENTSAKLKGWGKTVFFLNLVAAFVLLATQISSRISPEKFWPAEFMANSYPAAFLLNILFLLYWGIRRHRFFFLSAAIILIGYDKCILLYRPAIAKFDVTPPKNAFKVMSYNVRLFDLYNWSGNEKTRKSIMDFLKSEHPDILCFQEYFHCDEGAFRNNEGIAELLSLPHKSIKYGLTTRKINHWGIATFSKYPIVREGTLFFEEGKSNFCLWSDIVKEKDTIRVYNVHLQSNHFKEKDYQFMEHADSLMSDEELINTKSVVRRIRKAVRLRARQANELRADIEACPYPVIVCGDFNDTPFSYFYQTIRGDLTDAFLEKGEGFGNTYFSLPVKFRIDYILHSDLLQTYSFHTKEVKLSDHYPITAWLSLQKEE